MSQQWANEDAGPPVYFPLDFDPDDVDSVLEDIILLVARRRFD